MAHGDLQETNFAPKPVTQSKTIKLLDHAKLADHAGNGKWVDIQLLKAASIHFYGTFNSTNALEVRISNEADKPADNTHGVKVGSDVTTAGMVNLTSSLPVRWVKIKTTTVDAGSDISAVLHGIQ